MPDQSPQRNSPGARRRRGWEHKAGSKIYLEGLRFTRLHKRLELCPMYQQILNWIHFHETLLLEDNNSVAQCVLVFTFFGCLVCSKLNWHAREQINTIDMSRRPPGPVDVDSQWMDARASNQEFQYRWCVKSLLFSNWSADSILFEGVMNQHRMSCHLVKYKRNDSESIHTTKHIIHTHICIYIYVPI